MGKNVIQFGKAAPSGAGSFASLDLFTSVARDQQRVQTLHDDLAAIIEPVCPDTAALTEVIEAHGIPVITKGPEFQMKLAMIAVGARPGYIAPTLPAYADLVKTLCKHFPERNVEDFAHGMILILKGGADFSVLSYHFLHAMAYRTGLSGYDARARKLYDVYSIRYAGRMDPKFLDGLDAEETMALKMAIRREREALQFIRHLMHTVFIPTNNAKRLEKGTAQA